LWPPPSLTQNQSTQTVEVDLHHVRAQGSTSSAVKEKDSGRQFPIMSSRKKSLLKSVFGKKDEDEFGGGKGKKGKVRQGKS
jgi:hypothetical protein